MGSFLKDPAPIITSVVAIVSLLLATFNYFYIYRKDAQETKYSRANQVSSWVKSLNKIELSNSRKVESPDGLIVIDNGSNSPIFNAVVTFGAITGAEGSYLTGDGFAAEVGTIPPGKWLAKAPYPGFSMHLQLGTAICFTDVRGNSWLRDAKGSLRQVYSDPPFYMKLTVPAEIRGVEQYHQ